MSEGDSGWEVHRFGDRPRVVLHVPHAGLVVPPDVRGGIVLDDDGLERELARMTDRHTDVLALSAVEASGTDAIVVVNRVSRLVVDPERLPDDVEPMAAIGMGAVYRATSDLGVLRDVDPSRDADLRSRYFEPYAAAVTDVIDAVVADHGEVTIVDVHSYPSLALPYEREPTQPRPGVCLGTDPVHTPGRLVEAARAAFDGVGGGVDLDVPFAGTYVPLAHYGHDPRVGSLMLEIRRDLYMDEDTLALHDGADEVVARLAGFLAQTSRQ